MGRLRECREKANLSQKYVAISLGVASPSVANWEREKTNPTLDNAIQLADLYGVSLDYLLGRSNDLLFHSVVLRWRFLSIPVYFPSYIKLCCCGQGQSGVDKGTG